MKRKVKTKRESRIWVRLLITFCGFWVLFVRQGEYKIVKEWVDHCMENVLIIVTELDEQQEEKEETTKKWWNIQDAVNRAWNFTQGDRPMMMKQKTTMFFYAILHRKRELVRVVNHVIQDVRKTILMDSYHPNSQPSPSSKNSESTTVAVDKVFQHTFWKKLTEANIPTKTKRGRNLYDRFGHVCVPSQKHPSNEDANNNHKCDHHHYFDSENKQFEVSYGDHNHDIIIRDENQKKVSSDPLHEYYSNEMEYDYLYYVPNMVLQVIPSDKIGNYEPQAPSESETTRKKEIPCCLIDVSGDERNQEEEEVNTLLSSYQLVEQVYGQLGLIDVHRIDYAYKPVLSSSGGRKGLVSSTDTWLSPQFESTKSQNGGDQKGKWEWIFSTFGNSHTDENSEKNYHRMGDRAFAGGSQGEVWRARKRCNQIIQVRTNHNDLGPTTTTTTDPNNNYEKSQQNQQDSSDNSTCDENQRLIMKRLKVENGFKLLEAGLREVYFGDLLLTSSTDHTPPLFTKYVDHFFLKSSTAVDLWIVYEDAGPSIRSLIYTPISSGSFIVYQHSPLWRYLRSDIAGVPPMPSETTSSAVSVHLSKQQSNVSQLKDTSKPSYSSPEEPIEYSWKGDPFKNHTGQRNINDLPFSEGKNLLKNILKQILTSAAYLHKHGIVHRDIKPSNIMCQIGKEEDDHHQLNILKFQNIHCVLGDFSSAIDQYTSHNMYSEGPSIAEQTDEYAPPEILLNENRTWNPFGHPRRKNMESYDSWSIGVVILELLLGTPNVFSVDQRTTTVLTNKMRKKGASHDEIQRALYLAALSQFCIYMPMIDDNNDKSSYSESRKEWPLRDGDPLHNVAIVKTTCTIKDFHTALRARDPLGIGFDTDLDPLLNLVWGLLAWDPDKRLTPAEALNHYYFNDYSASTTNSSNKNENLYEDVPSKSSFASPGQHNALEPIMMDPRMVKNESKNTEITEFTCPKCGKKFHDINSCVRHATSRRHSKVCSYDSQRLPPCLNAHSMLPAHPTSGYCDIQGRRARIEDFHTIHLHDQHQFYGIFDGHNGNLASKYAAAAFYKVLINHLNLIDGKVIAHENNPYWKDEVTLNITDTFKVLNKDIAKAIGRNPGGVMAKSGTTATSLFVTENVIIVANVGDSRAILSVGASYIPNSKKSTLSYVQLTVDHVPSNQTERERIEDQGGFVSSVGGTARVNGTLAVSRSLGDIHLSSLLSRTPHVVVMSKEEIKEQCYTSNSQTNDDAMPCFIVLASDGLWDVITNQEAVEIVEHVIQRFEPIPGISWEDGGAFQHAAQILTQEAYVRGSTDNIGVCVVAII